MTPRSATPIFAILGAIASVGASCGKGGGTVTSHDPRRIGATAWKVDVDAVGGDPGFSFANVDEVVASRADHPIVYAGARIATDQPHAQATFDGPGHTDDEVIGVTPRADGWAIATLGGEHYTIADGAMGQARWYDLAPGVLGVFRRAGGATASRYQGGAAKAVWSRSIDGDVDDARVVGWLGDDVLLAVAGAGALAISRVHLADGAIKPIARIPGRLGRVAVSDGRFAVVTKLQLPDGAEPVQVEVGEVGSGAIVHRFDVATGGDAVYPFGDGVSIGFDGRSLWFYWYRPEHNSDVLGTKTSEACGYDVYDVETGKRVRSLADARGDWARVSKGCHVRGLVPTADGGAIAFAVGGDRKAEVIKFDGPP